MDISSYYVYALKDPTISPMKPFYIGKGTGNRAWEHEINPDTTKKGARISKIHSNGKQVIVSILAENLTEYQAIKLEAEMISAFGIEEAGGLLTNAVIPKGILKQAPKNLNIPLGVREKAQVGLTLLKEAIMELSSANDTGITNADAAKSLGLQSDFQGASKDYLSYSIIGLLLKEGKLVRKPNSRHYHSTSSRV